MIAKIIQKLDFELDPNHKFVLTTELTLRQKGGTRCLFKLRS
jgi:hypothetical protein